VLDLGNEKSILRVTVKGLTGDEKIGSVSFTATAFKEHAQKQTKDIWITLFDDENDDLYDGNFNEDDPEMPKIKISLTRGATPTIRKKGATKSKTLTVTTKQVERTQEITEEEVTKYSVETLKSELKTKLEELIDSLRTDIDDIHAENNERVSILQNLENVHEELKGEHEQDLAFGKALEELKNQILNDIGNRRKELEDQKNQLLEIIKRLEADTKASEKERSDAQNEKDRLTKIVETPEDLKENGFTPEAKNLRKENESNRTKTDKLTEELLSTRDNRNEIIQNHKELVGRFEDMVYQHHDELRKISQTKRSFAYERANLQKEFDFVSTEGDYFERKLQLADLDSKSLHEALNRLTGEYEETDKEFNRYTDQLRLGLKNQDFIINDLLKRFNARRNQISDLKNEANRQQNQIDHFQEEINKVEQIGYEEKFTKLHGDLKKIEETRKAHQEELERVHEGLTIKILAFSEDLQGRQKDRDSQLNEINNLIEKLNGATKNINDLIQEIENLDNKFMTDDNRDQISSRLAAEREAIDNKLKFALDERNKIGEELNEAIRTMDDKHRRIEEQRAQIDALRKDNAELKALIEEKRKIITQLEKEIQEAEDEIERLKGIVDDLNRKIADRDAEIERLKKLIDDHNRRIAQLEAEIGSEPAPVINYKAQKGDLIDEMLAQYIQNCPVPVKRLGDGFYLFGTRKIYAKIMNGKLVIRVGGGYMFIEKFIDTYAEQELKKLNSILEREGLTSIDQIDLVEYCLNRNRTSYGNTPGEASPSNLKSGDSKNTSFRKLATNSKLNGTNRSPKNVKTSQIVSDKN
jgi:chromosome segregation ATPase